MQLLKLFKQYIRRLIKPTRLVSIFRHYKYNKYFSSVSAQVGFDTLLDNTQLGEFVSIGDNCNLKNVNIGRHTYIGGNSCVSNAIIGSFCSISFNVTLGLSTHPSYMVSSHPAFYSRNKGFKTYADKNYYDEYGTLEIGNDVLIGKNAVIFYGVKVGNGAIITNNAVVTKDVPPYAIVGGVPAHIIKYRFDEGIRNSLNESQWWDWDEEKLTCLFNNFHDVQRFLEINKE